MLDKNEPKDGTCGGDPVSELLKLGDELSVSGTPTFYFENGHRSTGGMSAADLEIQLAEAKKSGMTAKK